MIESKNHYKFGNINFQVLYGELLTLHQWKGGDMKAPFWRAYFPIEKGGVLYRKKKKIPLMPGRGYIIPALTDYACDTETSFSKVFLHFSCEILGFFFKPGIYEFKIGECDLQKMVEIEETTNTTIHPALDLLILKMTAQGISEIPLKAITKTKVDPRIQNLVLWIKGKNQTMIPNEALAKKIGMTEQSMIRLFKSSMGSSPQKYQHTMRLQTAKSLLVYTDMTIEEIAEECGFWDRNHFSRSFKKFLNCPPAEYRKANK